MESSKLKLILASASPRRKELLGHLGLPFTILTENIPEDSLHKDPKEFSREIAKMKGAAVVKKLQRETQKENYFVVSADTIVYLRGKIYGKPRDLTDARQTLMELSGQTHSVFTAVVMCLIQSGVTQYADFVEESKVTFRSIPPDLMEKYLATQDSLDKAGAYGIQGPSLTFISKVEGCYANVVGFPLSQFVTQSEKFLKLHFHNEDSWFRLFHV